MIRISIFLGLVSALCLFHLSLGNVQASSPELELELRELDAMRAGRKTPADKVEKRGEELLEKHSAPADQAMIHYQLAHVHAQSGQTHPELVIVHCEKGLDLPLPPARRLQLYIYCGDAFQAISVDRAKGDKVPFHEMRKKAVAVYMKGLKDAEALSLPVNKPEVPSRPPILMPVGDAQDPAFQKKLADARKENEEYIVALQQARNDAEAWDNRRILYDQIVYLYLRQPTNDAELKESASKELPENVAKTLLTRLEEKAGERQKPPELPPESNEPVEPPKPRPMNGWLIALNAILFVAVVAVVYRRCNKGP
jgi:hypothetical protein